MVLGRVLFRVLRLFLINHISTIKVMYSAPLYRHRGSVHAVWPIGGVEVWLYSFLTTALEGGEWSASRPGRSLPPGKTRYPLYRRLGGPQGRSGQVREISHPPGFDPRTVQLVASRYTVYATRPTFPPLLYIYSFIVQGIVRGVVRGWCCIQTVWQHGKNTRLQLVFSVTQCWG